MKKNEKVYIGDGVYVSNDGWYTILETTRGASVETICLEPSMIFEVVKYAIAVGLVNAEGIVEGIGNLDEEEG